MLRSSASHSPTSGSGSGSGPGKGARSPAVPTFTIRLPSDRELPSIRTPVPHSGANIRTRSSPVATSDSASVSYGGAGQGPGGGSSAFYTQSSSSLASLSAMTLPDSNCSSRTNSDERDAGEGGQYLDPCAPVAIGIGLTPTATEGISQRGAGASGGGSSGGYGNTLSVSSSPPIPSPVPKSAYARAASSASVGRSSSRLEESASPAAASSSSSFAPSDTAAYSSSFRRLPDSPQKPVPQQPKTALGRLRKRVGDKLASLRAGGTVGGSSPGCRCHLMTLVLAIAYLGALFASVYFFHSLSSDSDLAGSRAPHGAFGSLGLQLTPPQVYSPFAASDAQHQLRVDLRSGKCSQWMEALWPHQSWRTSALIQPSAADPSGHHDADAAGREGGWLGRAFMFANAQAQQQQQPMMYQQHYQHAQQQQPQQLQYQHPPAHQQYHELFAEHEQAPPVIAPPKAQQHPPTPPVISLQQQQGQQQPQQPQPQQQPQQQQQQATPPVLTAQQTRQQPQQAQPQQPQQQPQVEHPAQQLHQPIYNDPRVTYAPQPQGQQPQPQQHIDASQQQYQQQAYAQQVHPHHQLQQPIAQYAQQQHQHVPPQAHSDAAYYPPAAHAHAHSPLGYAQELQYHDQLMAQIQRENELYMTQIRLQQEAHAAAIAQQQIIMQQQQQQQQHAPIPPALVELPHQGSVAATEHKLKQRAADAISQQQAAAAVATTGQASEHEHVTESMHALKHHADRKEQHSNSAPAAPAQPVPTEPARTYDPTARPASASLRLAPMLFYLGCSASLMLLPSLHTLLLGLNLCMSVVVLLREWMAERAARFAALAAKTRGGAHGSSTSGTLSADASRGGKLTRALRALFCCCCRKGRGSSRVSLAPPRPLPTVSMSNAHGTVLSSALAAAATPSVRHWMWALAFCCVFGCPAYIAERAYAEKDKRGKRL